MKTFKILIFIAVGCVFHSVMFSCTSDSKRRSDKTGVPIPEVSNCYANHETRALFYNLKRLSAEKLLFGHQDATAYGVNWKNDGFRSDVHDVCGKFPAVFGWDIGADLRLNHNIDTVDFESMKAWIRIVFKKRGINTISWHYNNPVTGRDAWDTTPAIPHILPGGEQHFLFIEQLDLVADFFLDLKSENGSLIPVVFRPYHENNGDWFWWGASSCTKEEFIELWQFTHTYLTQKREVPNLLFSYSPDIFGKREKYLERFPGTNYVDILGFDNYHDFTTQDGVKKAVEQLRIVVELAEEYNKVAALTETGFETIPLHDWWTENLLNPIKSDPVAKRIAWVLVWRNSRKSHHYAPFPGHPSVPDFIKFESDPFTVFLEDLPDMYRFP